MSDMMTFPDTWEEYEKFYGFNDFEEIYTNNSRLIPSFRVKQWLDHIAQHETKQQATVSSDCISRKFDVLSCLTYSKAKAKYEAWKKQKDGLRVGDEVIYHRNKYIVGYVGEDEVYHLVDQCWIRVVVQGDYQLTKTGRHFSEVAELLKKMRGKE